MRSTRTYAALAAGLVLLAGCSGGEREPDRERVVAGAVPEPVPFAVPTSPATDALPVIEPGGLRAPRGDEESRPWLLIRMWDDGSKLAVQYSAGCDDDVDVAFEETAAHVLVQVMDDPDRDCGGHQGVADSRAILALAAPLGIRPLLHAPTSARDEDGGGRSLAEVFEDAPVWPGDPWFQDGREVLHSELSVAAGPEHCDWQEAVYLGGNGLDAPRDQDGRLWSRDPMGVLEHFPRAQQEFRSPAVLPDDAVDTGYRQAAVELWVAPSDEARYVYFVNAQDRTDVERWVRGGGGCA